MYWTRPARFAPDASRVLRPHRFPRSRPNYRLLSRPPLSLSRTTVWFGCFRRFATIPDVTAGLVVGGAVPKDQGSGMSGRFWPRRLNVAVNSLRHLIFALLALNCATFPPPAVCAFPQSLQLTVCSGRIVEHGACNLTCRRKLNRRVRPPASDSLFWASARLISYGCVIAPGYSDYSFMRWRIEFLVCKRA